MSDEQDPRTHLHASVSTFACWGWWVGGVALGVVTCLVILEILAPSATRHDDDGNLGGLVAAFAALVPIGVLRRLRRRFGEMAVAREEAWLRSLPFPVRGYLEALGMSRTYGKATLTIRFTGTPPVLSGASYRDAGTRAVPEDEALAALFEPLEGALEPARTELERRVSYLVEVHESSPGTNAHLRAFVRDAIAALEELHEKHPIEEVRIGAFTATFGP